MPNLSIKDVPEEIAAKLRERAARNHRSLQGELMAIIEAAAQEPAGAGYEAGAIPPDWRRRLAAQGIPVLRQGWRTVEELAAQGVAGPSTAASAAEIVREMRDTHYGEAWVMARVKDGHWPLQPGDGEPVGQTVYCIAPKRSG